ncbi:MAG: response regulator [Gammaproteobacteria bacterium]|nr:response regulator [Gammaproteobacteria bacterium]
MTVDAPPEVAPSPISILIVDDDAAHAVSVRDLLHGHDYTIDVANGGRQGLERLRETATDVLILDLNMPEVSGLDVLSALSSTGQGDPPKTIVLSGETEVSQVAPVLRLGAYDYLTKPYDPSQLMASVRNAVERCRLEKQHRRLLVEREADNSRHAFLVNAAPDLIYLLDDAGRLTYHNDHLQDVWCDDLDRGDVGQRAEGAVPVERPGGV